MNKSGKEQEAREDEQGWDKRFFHKSPPEKRCGTISIPAAQRKQ
jgi:hypothetical protein